MTREERNKRWQEILDGFDRAAAELHESIVLDGRRRGSPLTKLIATLVETAAISKRIMDATMAANKAALDMYRDEREESANE